MYIIIYDFGTSSLKTCLFEVGEEIKVAATSNATYGIYFLENGGAEQDTEEWWRAICKTTKELFTKTKIKPEEISGLAFCAQMQGTVLVDGEGKPVRRAMTYLDSRGANEFKDCMGKGLVKISGCSLYKLFRNLRVNYAASTSAKDPVWKYKWVEKNEPEVFAGVDKWLDVSDYLVSRCTGKIIRTADSAFATFLYDTRRGKEGWNKGLLKMYGVNPDHMPPIIDSTDLVGGLTPEAADELGLTAGTPVFGGGGDMTFVNIGAGCTTPGDTHVYVGTSGWVSTYLDRQTVDTDAMITGVLSAIHGYFNYYAELETAGKCYEWVKDHLALDEINVYLRKTEITEDFESEFNSLYDYLSSEVSKVPPGANGVIFTPWLHGNRCPFEDADAGGMFFNIRIGNGKRDMIRAVLEGIGYHIRWLLECVEKKVRTSESIRFVGGGSISPVICQILADIIGRKIETVENGREAGAVGTAIVAASGLSGEDAGKLSKRLVKVNGVYLPSSDKREVYDRNYGVFKKLYKSNAAHFKALNSKKRNITKAKREKERT